MRENQMIPHGTGYVPEARKFLRKREVCRLLGISLATFDRMYREGRIPHIKLDAAVLIPASWVEELVERSSTEGVHI